MVVPTAVVRHGEGVVVAPAGRTRSARVRSACTAGLCALLTITLFAGVGVPAGAVPPPPPNPSDQQIQDSQSAATSSAAEVGRLSGLVSTTQGQITTLNNDLELKGELVKKAMIDQQLAEQDATTAQTTADTAERNAQAAGTAIADARTKAAAFAAASYRQGSVLGSMTALMDASSASDLLQRQQLITEISKSQLGVIAKLQTSLADKANLDSDARSARDRAEEAKAAAIKAASDAQTAKQAASDAFVAGKAQLATLDSRLDQQQDDYQLALSKVAGLKDQRAQYDQWLAAKKAEEERLRQEAIARAKAAAIAKAKAEKLAAEQAAAKAAAEARAAAAERARLQAEAKAAAEVAAEQAARQQAVALAAARQAKKAYDDEQAQLRAATAARAAASAQAAAAASARAVAEASARAVAEASAQAATEASAQAAAEASARAVAEASTRAAAVAAAEAEAAKPSPVYYANCVAVQAAGAAPLHRGSPGYRSALDTNGNGVACELLGSAGTGDADTSVTSSSDSSSGDNSSTSSSNDTGSNDTSSSDTSSSDSGGFSPPAVAQSDSAAASSPTVSSGGWSAAKGEAAVAAAERWVGTPYSWGGGSSSGPTTGICGPDGAYNDCNIVGFDCSGLTSYGWAQEGVSIPNYSVYQYTLGQHISTSDLLPGDLLFYANDTSDPSTIHHVAMYAGGGEMVEAPYSGAYVHVTSAAFDNGFIGATRPGT